MIVILSPLAPVPATSMSIVISASSAREASLITGGVAAVVLVFSDASIVIFVLSIVVPLSLISTVGSPEEEAVLNEALTAVTVIACGILNVTFAVPVVMSVVSSLAAITY